MLGCLEYLNFDMNLFQLCNNVRLFYPADWVDSLATALVTDLEKMWQMQKFDSLTFRTILVHALRDKQVINWKFVVTLNKMKYCNGKYSTSLRRCYIIQFLTTTLTHHFVVVVCCNNVGQLPAISLLRIWSVLCYMITTLKGSMLH